MLSQSYTLEYGEATVEIHDDAISPGETVLIVDDLLATGGTAEAGIKLLEQLGAKIIGCAFIIDLPDLGGRKKLEAMGFDLHTLCAFEGLYGPQPITQPPGFMIPLGSSASLIARIAPSLAGSP